MLIAQCFLDKTCFGQFGRQKYTTLGYTKKAGSSEDESRGFIGGFCQSFSALQMQDAMARAYVCAYKPVRAKSIDSRDSDR